MPPGRKCKGLGGPVGRWSVTGLRTESGHAVCLQTNSQKEAVKRVTLPKSVFPMFLQHEQAKCPGRKCKGRRWEGDGDPNNYPQPRSPGGRRRRKTQENEGPPSGRNWGWGISVWLLRQTCKRCFQHTSTRVLACRCQGPGLLAKKQ